MATLQWMQNTLNSRRAASNVSTLGRNLMKTMKLKTSSHMVVSEDCPAVSVERISRTSEWKSGGVVELAMWRVKWVEWEDQLKQPGIVVILRTPPSTANHWRASHAHFPYTARNFENASVTRQQQAQTPPSCPFTLCRHIAGWTQACN